MSESNRAQTGISFSFRVSKRPLHSKFLTNRRALMLAFALPLFVRLIPEIVFPVPVGFDTAILSFGAKYNPVPQFKFRILEAFILPYILHTMRVDLLLFMKFYSPVIYGSMVFLLTLYAFRVLDWNERKLFLLALVLTFSPTMLRMSWDNHSQNLATIFLLITLNVLGKKPSLFRLLAVIPLAALTALTHQLVSVVSAIILISEGIHFLKSLKRGLSSIPALATLMFAGIIIFLLNPLLTPMRIIESIQFLFKKSIININQFTLVLQALVSTWFLFPACIIGFMLHRRLFSWFIVCIAVYILSFFMGNIEVLVPGRWVIYSTIPLAFFVVNSYGKHLGDSRSKSTMLILTMVLTITTGVGMLFPSGTPVTSFMHDVYPEIPKTLASSTAKQEHIHAIQSFTNYLNGVDANACAITHYPYFFWWTGYLYVGKTVYIGPEYTTEQSLHMYAEKASDTCKEKIYLIWFSGLDWAKELQSIGELSLYRYP